MRVKITKKKLKTKISSNQKIGILKELVDKSLDKTSVVYLCELGDNRLIEETGKVFKKEKNLKKGTLKFVSYRL